MVARMMRWRPWPPLQSKKFEARLVVRRVEGLQAAEARVVVVEIRWKGPRAALSPLRRGARRNRTREEMVGDGGAVEWDEEFLSVCGIRETALHPWDVAFALLNGSNQGPKKKNSVMGMASLNLAEFASSAAQQEIEIVLPLSLPGVSDESHPLLHLSLSLLELRTSQESSEIMQRSITPVPLSPSSADASASEKDELSTLMAGLRKVKLFKELVSNRKSKKTSQEDGGSEGRSSDRSDDADYTYSCDTDSLDDYTDEGQAEDGKENSFRKSFSYGTLASVNYFGGSNYSDLVIDREYEEWVYYSHQRSDVDCSHVEVTRSAAPEQSSLQPSKRSILPWKKRNMSFRSPKAKGEPLLKKAYREEGGDDIDFDRRQLSSSDESTSIGRLNGGGDLAANQPQVSEFGDDNFAVGSWEFKEFVSRDASMKLCTEVFFASIDQRSERAAGESACTALVAVIADWFQANQDMMPIKSQFDSLIREGSLEWRNLCDNQTYRELFPDKHFDLETVLQAKIRPLSVVPEKSFIGFFHPEGTDADRSGFDFLHGAMSFDSIWDEISQAGANCSANGIPQIYVMSWNDHFFVLKVECDAYYIIDTLGERLHEGCGQAYILKFDESTSIYQIPEKDNKPATSDSAAAESKQVQKSDNVKDGATTDQLESGDGAVEELQQQQLVCRGKEACKEYIKSLAAIPIRELQADIKKGLMSSIPLHHRLQIEFHYTAPANDTVVEEAVVELPMPVEPAEFAASFTSIPALKFEVEVA